MQLITRRFVKVVFALVIPVICIWGYISYVDKRAELMRSVLVVADSMAILVRTKSGEIQNDGLKSVISTYTDVNVVEVSETAPWIRPFVVVEAIRRRDEEAAFLIYSVPLTNPKGILVKGGTRKNVDPQDFQGNGYIRIEKVFVRERWFAQRAKGPW